MVCCCSFLGGVWAYTEDFFNSYEMTKRGALLLIMVRNPLRGQVKTRLVTTMGCKALYIYLLSVVWGVYEDFFNSYKMTKRGVLVLIFVRNPLRGQVKMRLAATMGCSFVYLFVEWRMGLYRRFFQ